MSIRLSADIGGTFTDVVLERDGQLYTTKVLTTYEDPAAGVMSGIGTVLQTAAVAPQQVDLVLHGTTLATNALIERRGAVTGLITTAGHRDVLEMALENRFEQYDVNIDRPQPLVARPQRLGVDERMAADGTVLRALDVEQVLEQAAQLHAAGCTSIAIGFLHSYVNPTHERQARAAIEQAFPDISLSVSSEVCPEIREYERLSTTVANAYVRPLMASYLDSLQQQLRNLGITCDVLLMTSGGGLTNLLTASQFPIRLVESGPAGGAMLAAQIARERNFDRVMSFDMGGTTAKICLIDNAQPLQSRSFEVDRTYRFKKGSGLPVRIPVIEMVEIGAGGGSIASVDGLQRLHVGPESAGSEPGPSCYARGGERPTVTDADVVLGKLSVERFAGGALTLQPELARRSLDQAVGQTLKLDTLHSAYAVAEVVDENMASAARAHAAEWGKDLSDRVLIAFGGAAPLHAANLAHKLKMRRVLIPHGAGVGSALGFLLSPVRFEVVRSYVSGLELLDVQRVQDLFQQMRDEAMAIVQAAAGATQIDEQRHAYMRYQGQGYEVAVPVDESLDPGRLRAAFEQAYEQLYGRTIPHVGVEVLSWTLALTAPAGQQLTSIHAQEQGAESSSSTAQVDYFNGHEVLQAAVVERHAVTQLTGPAIVTEAQTTTVVPADVTVNRHADGTLELDLGALYEVPGA